MINLETTSIKAIRIQLKKIYRLQEKKYFTQIQHQNNPHTLVYMHMCDLQNQNA